MMSEAEPNPFGDGSMAALIVIDVQNDYFADGAFPQWEAERVLERIETLVQLAQARSMPVIAVQHIASESAPFFRPNTAGAALHPRLQALLGDAPRVIKQRADSFRGTTLLEILQKTGVRELYVCGMMTQNCVTHTALSPQAANYRIKVIGEACTSVSALIHAIALRALADRVEVIEAT